MTRLVIESDNESCWRIQWEDPDDGLGGYLCQSRKDGYGEAPSDREEWEHWAASKAARGATGVKYDGTSAYWETKNEATGALRLARAALKQERELPAWAKTALEQGWKPPRGWKV